MQQKTHRKKINKRLEYVFEFIKHRITMYLIVAYSGVHNNRYGQL